MKKMTINGVTFAEWAYNEVFEVIPAEVLQRLVSAETVAEYEQIRNDAEDMEEITDEAWYKLEAYIEAEIDNLDEEEAEDEDTWTDEDYKSVEREYWSDIAGGLR